MDMFRGSSYQSHRTISVVSFTLDGLRGLVLVFRLGFNL